ncbi:DUF423 domain-containing protein [Rubinisphaera italica]|uniref:DUF423 domain-containing protein n=1 Tax=Rubinisphaera italica TaxID=2527969 RepID=A0A5C5XII3_9PLAN|nr:DUF423 domain-containing protein [Rubinisphaera italica]TWT62509.1 hypothetical protein Pan54_32510 [Rubinisphaera italica]
MNRWGALGAVLAFWAVIFGAFAAHGLEDRFIKLYGDQPPKMVMGHPIPAAHKYLQDFKTGAEYQFWHAFGLLFIGAFYPHHSRRLLNAAGYFFVTGILLFSGCLYLLALLNQPWLGMIVPLGGLSFLIGWFLLAIGLCKSQEKEIVLNG